MAAIANAMIGSTRSLAFDFPSRHPLEDSIAIVFETAWRKSSAGYETNCPRLMSSSRLPAIIDRLPTVCGHSVMVTPCRVSLCARPIACHGVERHALQCKPTSQAEDRCFRGRLNIQRRALVRDENLVVGQADPLPVPSYRDECGRIVLQAEIQSGPYRIAGLRQNRRHVWIDTSVPLLEFDERALRRGPLIPDEACEL